MSYYPRRNGKNLDVCEDKTLSMSSIGVLSASFIIRQNCHYLILSLYHLRQLMVAKQQI